MFEQVPDGDGTWLASLAWGLKYTLVVAALAWIIAFVLGSILGVMRTTENKWAVRLGVFSYSLYLVHSPLISLVHIALRSQHLSPLTRFILMPIVGVPVILSLSYLFHLAFEKRFLGSSKQPETQNVAAGRT